MAANLRDVKFHQKRKHDEVDKKDPASILAKDRAHHKKLKVTFKGLSNTVYVSPADEPRLGHHLHRVTAPLSPPHQQRSPSPTEMSPQHEHLHPLLHHLQHYEGPVENSPLLTPKDEDDDDDDEHAYPKNDPSPSPGTSTACTTPPASSPINDTSNNDEKSSNTSHHANLDTNTDYISLTSSLRLLNSNKEKITGEMAQLAQLQEFHMKNNDKTEIINFFMKLVNNELDLPKPNKVLKAPTVDWAKYHSGLGQVSADFKKELSCSDKPDSLYKSLRLFDKI
ncbi:uncharacterized protein CANTADRAFT_6906 [Suhomyces tanzawaensis NRRL Y-17324]|uniref:Uncharacterized protein n=1 Tax=Suhomyces tanzawaensis NRRL Y-17324 TaxID=984487 RepID=A0A1E4SGA4_9ASCO|nr:uncharacterized protein CANTADRAFT_6906 [Suhomyces tanzawaensis NRRL Y-17324]ODV78541.1 hypothetical protein CANTADRAFT_6906 [Suhomyces tanzawaensis NRRL Y-17324]